MNGASRPGSGSVARVYVSKRADEELRQIWRDIAVDNMGAADRVLLRLGARMEGLAKFPELGRRRDEIRRGARVLIEGHYIVLYGYHARRNEVDVIAVVDARRDLTRIF